MCCNCHSNVIILYQDKGVIKLVCFQIISNTDGEVRVVIYVLNSPKNHFRVTLWNSLYLVSMDVLSAQIVFLVKIQGIQPPRDFHIEAILRSSAQKTPKNGQKCHFSSFDQYFGSKFFMKTASNQKSRKVSPPDMDLLILKMALKFFLDVT